MRVAALPAKRIEFQHPCRIAHFEVDSLLPLDLGNFQWNGDAVVVRDHSRRIVGGRACGRHLRIVSFSHNCSRSFSIVRPKTR
jgi:hypothetical protein